jgi:hypothetical protein
MENINAIVQAKNKKKKKIFSLYERVVLFAATYSFILSWSSSKNE